MCTEGDRRERERERGTNHFLILLGTFSFPPLSAASEMNLCPEKKLLLPLMRMGLVFFPRLTSLSLFSIDFFFYLDVNATNPFM